jgi:hypothetical protein
MALASCPDCNREVSTRAHHCVHCGRPWPGRTCGAACAVALAAIVALCVFAGVIFMKARCAKMSAVGKCAPAVIERAPEAFPGDCVPGEKQVEKPKDAEAPAVPATPKEE